MRYSGYDSMLSVCLAHPVDESPKQGEFVASLYPPHIVTSCRDAVFLRMYILCGVVTPSIETHVNYLCN